MPRAGTSGCSGLLARYARAALATALAFATALTFATAENASESAENEKGCSGKCFELGCAADYDATALVFALSTEGAEARFLAQRILEKAESRKAEDRNEDFVGACMEKCLHRIVDDLDGGRLVKTLLSSV